MSGRNIIRATPTEILEQVNFKKGSDLIKTAESGKVAIIMSPETAGLTKVLSPSTLVKLAGKLVIADTIEKFIESNTEKVDSLVVGLKNPTIQGLISKLSKSMQKIDAEDGEIKIVTHTDEAISADKFDNSATYNEKGCTLLKNMTIKQINEAFQATGINFHVLSRDTMPTVNGKNTEFITLVRNTNNER